MYVMHPWIRPIILESPGGTIHLTQKAAMWRMACDELLDQCPELVMIQSCQDLCCHPAKVDKQHPLQEAKDSAADAEKCKLAELGRNAFLIYEHLKTLLHWFISARYYLRSK
ncbi:hypothetical protein BDB01DRAFT_831272 [Pilobolus umbonatus]|nr:hypothetical protein BDB01DRAFT_831272 [Pilobolus umbonatus]